jgi:F-type H+-transporting ATPase subunit epsilon
VTDFVDAAGVGVMHVTVVSPERQVFDGEATALVAPAYDGQVGILPRHAPLLTLLGKGDLIVRHGGAEARRFAVAGGFLQVAANRVRVVVERADAAPTGPGHVPLGVRG